jgi:hypothetical protein
VNGCLKGLVRLFVFALLLVGVAAAYWYREPIGHAFARLVGRRETALPKVSPDAGVGAAQAREPHPVRCPRLGGADAE